MTVVLTCDPLLDGITSLLRPYVMSNACKGYATKNGNTQIVVAATSSVLDKNGIANDTKNLDAAIRKQAALGAPFVVFGWSRGAQLVGRWLRLSSDGVDPKLVKFILIGNPERSPAHGGLSGQKYVDGTPLISTPDNTAFTVLDIARKGDMFADAPESNIFTGLLIHCSYFNVDLGNLSPIKTTVVGNTTYYVIP